MAKNVFILPVIICTLYMPLFTTAQIKFPSKIEIALKKAKNNRAELEKTIIHFSNINDSAKLHALYFLIENMDIHFSQTYYWADSLGNRIEFNELNYSDFKTSVNAFDSLKRKIKKIHPVVEKLNDLETITSKYLIDNINNAFSIWIEPWAREISSNLFYDYILPYRISVEPLQEWRNTYNHKFSFVTDKYNPSEISTKSKLKTLITDINNWFTCTYNFEKRSDPLPRLGALQLLHRKKGLCEDVADLSVFCLRSQGIGTTVDNIPYWATSTGGHSFNVVVSENKKPIPFDVLFKSDSLYGLVREPAKVLRTTYSIQKNTLAANTDLRNIPTGMLQSKNYLDVTKEYWEVSTLKTNLSKSFRDKEIAYACVLNGLVWQPTWWGKVKNETVTFENMGKGAVYLPMYYYNGKMLSAGNAIVSDYDTSYVLNIDTINTHTITITEKEKYLVFKTGKKYRLFYWSDKWIPLGVQIPKENSKQLVFEDVPQNALLLLLPENSQRKERPFIITNAGQRKYY